jgi:group I intron endonuclease
MTWCVYLIRNKANGKGYVGITTKNIDVRLAEHCADSSVRRRGPNGKVYALSAAIRKYGAERFTIKVLEDDLGLWEAQDQEAYWIEQKRTYASGPIPRRGYNMSRGGEEPDWNPDEIV